MTAIRGPGIALIIAAAFSLPLSARADSSMLLWGNDDATAPAQISIQDGGTYTLPLNVEAPGYVSTSTPGAFVATLSLVQSDGSLSQIATLSSDPTSPTQFSWPQTGEYQLDIKKISVPVFGANLIEQFFVDLFAPRAYAQSAPSVVETIHFTVQAQCQSECYDNVMFLPGIESSRLYDSDDGGTRLWEPGNALISGDAAAQQLAMNSDGTSVRSDIYTRDVIDNAYVPKKGDVYASFIGDMNNLKNAGTINDWQYVAYDWRLPLDQILSSGKVIDDQGDISYLDATDTPYIIQELKDLAATSKSGKVTIVAHSNGGLLAKALMANLGADAPTYVDKIILVASPQIGTPQGIAGLLLGSGQGYTFPWNVTALSAGTARTVGDTMPGLYNLLPSAPYFTYVDDPVITFDTNTAADLATKYGAVIHSQELLDPYLTDSSRKQPDADDLNDPTSLNSSFITQAEQAHDSLDAWTPPTGVQVLQIAGWGDPTVLGINYSRVTKNGNTTLKPEPQFTVDGDGTVVVPSALWTSTSDGAQDYWFDLNSYNGNIVASASRLFTDLDHHNILEGGPLLDFINDEITGNVKSLSRYGYIFDSPPASTGTRLRYALHSPLTLDLYDDQGNHTGISTTTGEIEEQIPGTYYVQFGDVKYIFADTGSPQHIVMRGYDTGTFTFGVSELQGDGVVATTEFKDVPVTPETQVSFSVSSGLDSASDLSVDEDGDGTADSTYASSSGDLIVPPVPQITTNASQSSGGGGGGIPSLLPQAASTTTTVATITAAASSYPAELHATTSPVVAVVPHASSSRPVAVVGHKKPPRPALSTTASSTLTQHSQVAAVAQSTGGGLWQAVWGWIMKTLHSLL